MEEYDRDGGRKKRRFSVWALSERLLPSQIPIAGQLPRFATFFSYTSSNPTTSRSTCPLPLSSLPLPLLLLAAAVLDDLLATDHHDDGGHPHDGLAALLLPLLRPARTGQAPSSPSAAPTTAQAHPSTRPSPHRRPVLQPVAHKVCPQHKAILTTPLHGRQRKPQTLSDRIRHGGRLTSSPLAFRGRPKYIRLLRRRRHRGLLRGHRHRAPALLVLGQQGAGRHLGV